MIRKVTREFAFVNTFKAEEAKKHRQSAYFFFQWIFNLICAKCIGNTAISISK